MNFSSKILLAKVWFIRILLTFDKFENVEGYKGGGEEQLDGYGNLREALLWFGRFLYQSLSLIAVYCSGIAILITATCLVLHSRNRIKLGEAKKSVVRVLVVSILIFSVSGILTLVKSLAIKGI